MNDHTVVEWVGDVDLSTAVIVGAELDRAFRSSNCRPLVIDLARVGFVDSVGLGVLIDARTSTLEAGTTITLRAVPPSLRRLLSLSGLDDLFAFDDPHPEVPIDPAVLPESSSERAEPDGKFDRVAALASRLLNVPTALVSMVDQQGQVFPGAVGLPQPWQEGRATPLTHSYCQYVVARAAPLVVADARTDPLFADNLATSELGVTAYAGMPLTDHTGRVVGSLCAIDSKPREWTEAELQDLRDLAGICSAEVTYRSAAEKATLAAERDRFVRGVQEEVVDHLLKLATMLGSVQSLTSNAGVLGGRIAEALAEAELALTTLRTTVFGVQRRNAPVG